MWCFVWGVPRWSGAYVSSTEDVAQTRVHAWKHAVAVGDVIASVAAFYYGLASVIVTSKRCLEDIYQWL